MQLLPFLKGRIIFFVSPPYRGGKGVPSYRPCGTVVISRPCGAHRYAGRFSSYYQRVTFSPPKHIPLFSKPSAAPCVLLLRDSCRLSPALGKGQMSRPLLRLKGSAEIFSHHRKAVQGEVAAHNVDHEKTEQHYLYRQTEQGMPTIGHAHHAEEQHGS